MRCATASLIVRKRSYLPAKPLAEEKKHANEFMRIMQAFTLKRMSD